MKPLLLLAVAIAAVSSSAVLVRYAEVSAIGLAFWRTAGGALVLAAPALASTERPERHHAGLLVVAGTALGVHFAVWLASLELTSVAASVTLVTTAPLMIAIGQLVTGHRPPTRTWLAIGFAICGTAVIAGADLGSGRDAILGDVLALAGAAAMAVYLSAGNRLRSTLSTATYAAATYAIAALVLAVAAAATATPLWGYSSGTWWAIGGMIVGPQLLGHTMLNLLLRELGSVTVSVSLLAEPLVASVFVLILFAELPPLAAVVGAPLVVAGLMLQISGFLPRSGPNGATVFVVGSSARHRDVP